VLAAGVGRRLAPLTDDLPKALLGVDGETSILDIALANLRGAGIEEVVVVTGFASHQIENRVSDLQRRHDVKLSTIWNDKAEVWNNAYSLWLARSFFGAGVLLCNGDTVHPISVEHALLAASPRQIVLAIDDRKALAEEEMKVILNGAGTVKWINKAVDPTEADGEYIGVSRIEPGVADDLAAALEETWRRDPDLYYEDGFQVFIEGGGAIEVAPIGEVDWVEVDNLADLARARSIACHY
jgi:choline kinase